MIEVSKCVVCEGAIRQLKRALVAPFLTRRIWDRAPFCVDLVQCQSCGFRFFNPRLEDSELGLFYKNYHSEEYQKMRYSSEPWYTRKFNADLLSDHFYGIHRDCLIPVMREHLRDRQIKSVLDYGGDRGDLVVGMFPDAEAFVYDISGVEPVDGVKPTADPASCNPDLIISSNVLEHVGFPREHVAAIFECTPEGGLVFLEVPCENPFGLKRILRRGAQIIVVAVTRPRLAKYIVRPAALYTMHEHINYFDEKSLTSLMRSCGGQIIASGSFALPSRAGKGTMTWCLGSKPTLR